MVSSLEILTIGLAISHSKSMIVMVYQLLVNALSYARTLVFFDSIVWKVWTILSNSGVCVPQLPRDAIHSVNWNYPSYRWSRNSLTVSHITQSISTKLLCQRTWQKKSCYHIKFSRWSPWKMQRNDDVTWHVIQIFDTKTRERKMW